MIHGDLIYLNTSMTDVVKLRSICLADMRNLLARFRREQKDWLLRLLTKPRRDIAWGKITDFLDMPFGLSGCFYQLQNANGVTTAWHFYILRRRYRTNEASAFIGRFKAIANGTPLTAIHNMSFEEQKTYVRLLLGDTVESISASVAPKWANEHVRSELEDWLAEDHDVDLFLERLSRLMMPELAPSALSTRERNRAVVMFLAFLNREGLILLPASCLFFNWLALRERLTPCFTETFLTHVDRVREVSRVEERTSYKTRDLLPAFRALKLTSSITCREDLSGELCQRFKIQFRKRTDVGWAINTFFDASEAMLGRSPSRRGRELLRPRDLRLSGRGPYDWVKDPTFPGRKQIIDYTPRVELFYWADFFEDVLPLLKLKTFNQFQTTANKFLTYLNTLPEVPGTFEQIDARQHIYDPRGASNTFRDFLAKEFKDDRNNLKTAHLARLATMFRHHIEANGLHIPNPVDLRAAKFRGSSKRGKTPRSALDPVMLETIREFNARDDFAFAKSIEKQKRNVFNPATGLYEEIWFPAYAIATDALLDLPFRSHQVRYFDSGEGDEIIFDPVSRQMRSNTGPLAQRGRRSAALQLVPMTGRANETVLGIFVNTNKTSNLEKQGYTIPWCSPELEANLRRMSSWVQTYYPITHPIKPMEESYLDEYRSEEITALIPDVFPLFRDPGRRDGQPLSRELMFDYWTALLAAVEDELNADRPPERRIFLTYIRNTKSGPKRVPIFDIHCLRVSGITAMIERGLPPDLVQEIVGHASLVMTLYYNKVRLYLLYQKLEEYYAQRGLTADALRNRRYEEIESEFFNMRGPEDAVGHDMLRSRMAMRDPSWKVLSHGICPGGDCATGGEWYKNAHRPLRPNACSLCRYRLTGPVFLPGMVANANLLMFEMRRLGQEITRLQVERNRLEDARESTTTIDGQMESARRSFDDFAQEWAAEVQYIHAATDLFNRQMAETGEKMLPALMTPLGEEELLARLDQRHELHLLQSIAKAAEVRTGFRTGAREAIKDRDDFLNRVLDAQGYGALLLRLPQDVRLKVGNLLGDFFTDLVPDAKLDGLAQGATALDDITPLLRSLTDEIAGQINSTGTVETSRLATLPNLLSAAAA
jgi:hypothetical protein